MSRSVKNPRNPLLLLAIAAAVSGCASPGSAGDDTFFGVGQWFNPEKSVEVAEAGRSQHCGTEGGDTRVQLLANAAAVREWEIARRVALGSEELPDTSFALVEMGARESGGYGFAVSRVAGYRGDMIVLKLTSFAPSPNRSVNPGPTAPCVLVSLPGGPWNSLRVTDQSGLVRAAYPPPAK